MRNLLVFRSAALAAIALASAGAASAQNIVTNGSFETPVVAGSFVTYGAGSSSLTGWTIGGGGIDHIRTNWQAADGAQSLDMSATSTGSISQTLTTVIGQSYTLSFALAGNPDGGIKTLAISFGGTPLTDQTFNTAGRSTSDMGWSVRSFFVTATSTSSVLTFTSLTNTSAGPALDNVSVVANTAAPEPGALALALPGFAALGVVLRRRPRPAA
jgi:choice-of-anchor C domain-containing protein